VVDESHTCHRYDTHTFVVLSKVALDLLHMFYKSRIPETLWPWL